MKFNCKEISISDEELGCTLVLSENKEAGYLEMNHSTKEILDETGQYILLQRTYPEDDFEENYYYFETSDDDDFEEFNDFEINLSRNLFQMTFQSKIIEIQISTDEILFENLKLIIKKICNGRGQVNCQD